MFSFSAQKWFSRQLRQSSKAQRQARERKRRQARRFEVEQLEGRVVPTVLDLTAAGASGLLQGALYRDISTSPTGSGNVHSFVRLDASGTEQGYNTSFRPLE